MFLASRQQTIKQVVGFTNKGNVSLCISTRDIFFYTRYINIQAYTQYNSCVPSTNKVCYIFRTLCTIYGDIADELIV